MAEVLTYPNEIRTHWEIDGRHTPPNDSEMDQEGQHVLEVLAQQMIDGWNSAPPPPPPNVHYRYSLYSVVLLRRENNHPTQVQPENATGRAVGTQWGRSTIPRRLREVDSPGSGFSNSRDTILNFSELGMVSPELESW